MMELLIAFAVVFGIGFGVGYAVRERACAVGGTTKVI